MKKRARMGGGKMREALAEGVRTPGGRARLRGGAHTCEWGGAHAWGGHARLRMGGRARRGRAHTPASGGARTLRGGAHACKWGGAHAGEGAHAWGGHARLRVGGRARLGGARCGSTDFDFCCSRHPISIKTGSLKFSNK
jgi:hypothetical protein